MRRLSPIIMLIVLFTVTAVFLTACGTSPPARYYSLSTIAPVKSPEVKIQSKDVIVISVGPVGIPDYLQRQEIVTRDSGNRLIMGDFDLWGSSLENDVNLVLVSNLSTLLNNKGIGVVTWRARVPASLMVSVSMTRFEAAGDSVVLTAQWGILERGGDKVETLRESIITKPAGKDYSDIVGAMSDSLADLSREIAAEVQVIVNKGKQAEK
jgi:uncharacterized protein